MFPLFDFRPPLDIDSLITRRRTLYHGYDIINIKKHSRREIEDFVQTHLCKLCVILQSRVLLGVCPR